MKIHLCVEVARLWSQPRGTELFAKLFPAWQEIRAYRLGLKDPPMEVGGAHTVFLPTQGDLLVALRLTRPKSNVLNVVAIRLSPDFELLV
jgi:hypothetical protein